MPAAAGSDSLAAACDLFPSCPAKNAKVIFSPVYYLKTKTSPVGRAPFSPLRASFEAAAAAAAGSLCAVALGFYTLV